MHFYLLLRQGADCMIPSQSPLPISTILDLWGKGHDTREIARILGTHESVIYNGMARLREQRANRIALGFKLHQGSR